MLCSYCPRCCSAMHVAAVGAAGLVVVHFVDETYEGMHGLVAEQRRRIEQPKPLPHQHTPDTEPTQGQDMPGLYAYAAPPVTTTTQNPMMQAIHLSPPPGRSPGPGLMWVWNKAALQWAAARDCGVTAAVLGSIQPVTSVVSQNVPASLVNTCTAVLNYAIEQCRLGNSQGQMTSQQTVDLMTAIRYLPCAAAKPGYMSATDVRRWLEWYDGKWSCWSNLCAVFDEWIKGDMRL
jgi:hypothetical protein